MRLNRLALFSRYWPFLDFQLFLFFSYPAASGVLGGGGGAFLVEVVLLRGAELGESMVGAHRRNYARKVVTELVAAISASDFLPFNVTATLFACVREGSGEYTRS